MPKDGEWWFEAGILTSGNDPAPTLENANFPDEYTPMVFMTGDGHRHPPFQWTTRGVWPNFFRDLVADNSVCCHVEVFADAVAIDSVPPLLADVFRNGKVWGWELEVWKTVDRILQDLMTARGELNGPGTVSQGLIRSLSKDMWAVRGMGYLRTEGQDAMAYWDQARVSRHSDVPVAELPGFDNFLRDYQNTAMNMRTAAEIHAQVARSIQAKIDQYPDHMHLITCGNQHLIVNPLHRLIRPPVGCFGVADPNQN